MKNKLEEKYNDFMEELGKVINFLHTHHRDIDVFSREQCMDMINLATSAGVITGNEELFRECIENLKEVEINE